MEGVVRLAGQSQVDVRCVKSALTVTGIRGLGVSLNGARLSYERIMGPSRPDRN